ncbi:MAG: hypothetical protein D6714_19725 [Bacteroidetes bacterium]|nr:MAG: hypothetical protein D6714_19725 [Bacteroidota bacterium]
MKRHKEELLEELKNISPTLARLKDEPHGFKVPENYFKTLPGQVFERLGNEPNPLHTKQKTSPGFFDWLRPLLFAPRLRPALVGAASVLLIAAAFFFRPIPQENELMTYNEIAPEDASQYIESNLEDFETDWFLEGGDLTLENLNTVNTSDGTDEYLDDIITDMDIEDIEDLL